MRNKHTSIYWNIDKPINKQKISKDTGLHLSTVKRFYMGVDVKISSLVKISKHRNKTLEETIKERDQLLEERRLADDYK